MPGAKEVIKGIAGQLVQGELVEKTHLLEEARGNIFTTSGEDAFARDPKTTIGIQRLYNRKGLDIYTQLEAVTHLPEEPESVLDTYRMGDYELTLNPNVAQPVRLEPVSQSAQQREGSTIKNREERQQAHERDLGKRVADIAYAFFHINEDRTGFANNSTKDLVYDAYRDEIDAMEESARKQRAYYYWSSIPRSRESLQKVFQGLSAEKRKKVAQDSRLGKLLAWLDTQPEYAGLNEQELIAVMDRKTPFSELARRVSKAQVSSNGESPLQDGQGAGAVGGDIVVFGPVAPLPNGNVAPAVPRRVDTLPAERVFSITAEKQLYLLNVLLSHRGLAVVEEKAGEKIGPEDTNELTAILQRLQAVGTARPVTPIELTKLREEIVMDLTYFDTHAAEVVAAHENDHDLLFILSVLVSGDVSSAEVFKAIEQQRAAGSNGSSGWSGEKPLPPRTSRLQNDDLARNERQRMQEPWQKGELTLDRRSIGVLADLLLRRDKRWILGRANIAPRPEEEKEWRRIRSSSLVNTLPTGEEDRDIAFREEYIALREKLSQFARDPEAFLAQNNFQVRRLLWNIKDFPQHSRGQFIGPLIPQVHTSGASRK